MSENVERDDSANDGESTHEHVHPSAPTAPAKYSFEWWEARNNLGRCKAHRKNGDRCKRPTDPGAAVCGHHGARAPAVRRRARQRLEEATDRMARELLKMAVNPDVADAVKLRAITEALDRGNLATKTEIEISASPFHQIGETVMGQLAIGGSRAEFRRSQGATGDESDERDPLAELRAHDVRAAMRDEPRAIDRHGNLVIDAEIVPDLSGHDRQPYPDSRDGYEDAPSERTAGHTPPSGGLMSLPEAVEQAADMKRLAHRNSPGR